MADCNDLTKQLQDLEDRLRQLDELEAAADSILDTEGLPAAGPSRNVLRTYTGQQIGLSREAWVKQSEQDMVAMGGKVIRDLVEMGFRNKEGPRGETGRMVNYGIGFPDYSKVAPSDENIAALMETIGVERANTPKGVQLKRKFTSTVAGNALIRFMRENNASAEAIASALNARLKGIDKLPETIVSVAKARWDSVSQYAAKIEQAANAMEVGALGDELRVELGYAAQWAHFFENLDAAARRRVGQAMRGLQYDFSDAGFELFGPDPNLARLTIQDINGETLVGQVMEHIERGDVMKLRQLAAAARTNSITRTSINEAPFFSQLHLLNNFRRNNMLTSPTTWLVRNPVSGLGVAFYRGLQDITAGALRAGARGGMEAAFFANRATLDAAQMAWKNGITYLGTGKARMGLDNAMEVAPEIIEREKQMIDDALTTGVTLLQQPSYWANTAGMGPAVTLMNVLNASVSKVLGGLGERYLGWNGGYLPAFRLLGAGDEAVRSMAYAWKVNHEAYIRAFEEAKQTVDQTTGRQVGSDWVAQRAEQMAEDSMFSGYMSAEDLVKLRRERGLPPGEELPDDVLRLMAFNDLKGVPRADDELGQIGLQRAAQVTFTETIKDPIIQGLGVTRQNALVAWQLPFFKTPLNSLIWSLDQTIVPSVLKALRTNTTNATPAEIADARAQAIVSAMFLTMGAGAISSGVFTGGGPSDPEEYQRWRRVNTPYSFQIGGKVIPAARFRVGGLDPIDILGLYADLQQLVMEEGISEGDYMQASTGLVTALARMFNNKASLLNTTTVLNAMTQPDRTDMADVLASSMGGLFPLSGLAGRISAMGRGAMEATEKRRFMSAEEKKALGMDPIYTELVAPVLQFVQAVGEKVARPYPGANQLLKAPVRRDWLGAKVERPFGIPVEAVVPFMPVLQPQDPLYLWLNDAGITTKPRPDGKVGTDDGLSVGMQMTNDEEGFYREQMSTIRGERPAADVLGTARVPIDQFVQGRTMAEALRALMRDPVYRSWVNIDPEGPDKRVNKAKLTDRKKSEGYQPIDEIIRYYDMLALVELMGSDHPASKSFTKRYEAMVRSRSEQLRKREEALSVLGWTRQ
jgi:hypothetical protein